MALKFTLDETRLNSLRYDGPPLQGGLPAISDDSLLSPNAYNLSPPNNQLPRISDDSLLSPNAYSLRPSNNQLPRISDDSLLSPNAYDLRPFDDEGPRISDDTLLSPGGFTSTSTRPVVSNTSETRLKSLKYGDFSSRNSDPKPLVTKDINKNPSRNGIELQASARVDDLVRISSLLGTKAGTKFTVNQAALAAIDVKPKVGGTRIGNLLRRIGGGLIGAGGAISSALAQVPVSGTGLHFVYGLRGAGGTYTNKNGADLAREGALILPDGDTLLESIFAARNGGRQSSIDSELDNDDIKTQPKNDKEHKVTVVYNPPIEPFKEQNFGLGDPGSKAGPYRDAANAAPINGTQKDLIKFFFRVITPDETRLLTFRAFLDTFNDSFNGDWSGNKYIGRAEDFYVYGGFSRTVNIGFKIAAQTQQEMQPLYEKINNLASATTPTYAAGDGATFMRGTFIRATVGDYLRNVPAILQNISFNWITSYPWQTRLNADDRELPMVLDCSLTLGIIHDFVPRAGTNPYINSYISSTTTAGVEVGQIQQFGSNLDE